MLCCLDLCDEEPGYDSDDDRNGVPTKKSRRQNSSVIHAYLSFQRGMNEDGRHCVEIVNRVSQFLQTNGLNLLSEHDKLNIEGIGLAKSMILFITKQYLAKENYGLDKELMRRYINRKGEDKHIVVVLEESMKNSDQWGELSPLGAAIAGLPYVDLTSSDEMDIEQKHKEILDSINEKASMDAKMSERFAGSRMLSKG